jgi:hypothetical protein
VPIRAEGTVYVTLYQGACGSGIGAGHNGTIAVEPSDRR